MCLILEIWRYLFLKRSPLIIVLGVHNHSLTQPHAINQTSQTVWMPASLQWRHYERDLASHITSRLFTQPFIQAQIEENIKDPRHWPLWGEFTSDQWIPCTKYQWHEKCFHLMTSSCSIVYNWLAKCPSPQAYHWDLSRPTNHVSLICIWAWPGRIWQTFYPADHNIMVNCFSDTFALIRLKDSIQLH